MLSFSFFGLLKNVIDKTFIRGNGLKCSARWRFASVPLAGASLVSYWLFYEINDFLNEISIILTSRNWSLRVLNWFVSI